ncbi:unnamed protein product [Cuscuta epithymum]|uniref:FAF domain-containing protein n=1 Tax=Cuscuta epithymum TaxID=186058 RepID=A0AAV0FC71_9ASTE|nr:unnamed protein product [Cuscuta epithymum]
MPPHACVIMTQSSTSVNPELQVAAQPCPPPPLPPPAKKLKQGISSILAPENDDQGGSSAPSIRRTLSADMSSKKWASQTGFAPEEERRSSSVSDRPGQDEVWRAIQEKRLINHGSDDLHQGPPPTITRAAALPSASSTESFSSILDSSLRRDVFAPYIQPKKQPKKLSAKSLFLCTEILGSETGAEDFQSDLPPLPTNRKKPPLMNMYMKRSAPRPLPPPLPSLDMNKTTVQVRTRREDGRLIVEAVSVPPREHLRAERSNGRLFISLINSGSGNGKPKEEEPEFVFNFEEAEVRNEEDEEEEGDDGDKEEQGDDRNGMGIPAEQDSSFSGRRCPPPMRFPGLIFKKNRALMEDLIVNQAHSRSLPPAPGVAGLVRENPPVVSVTFVNDYDYFWRPKPATPSKDGAAEHLIQKLNDNDNNNNIFVSMEEQRKRDRLGLLRRINDKKMPPAMLNGACKDGRRSSLLHRPNLIAGRSN